ncbi:hypothetical protein FVO59_11795 [Microbacterium esteraromaticum]|uniref:Uncharacterized protein n=1 Tax=Microbacterium esteraromaticum TaxID=57043 RepID=A0A7D7WGU0_9MICO|nr:hypothetical protein [Microbacterium esteraromaticum]QMU97811.1 hypothetical protein FVO59_11795 [Microbacterium esteraromaticum]
MDKYEASNGILVHIDNDLFVQRARKDLPVPVAGGEYIQALREFFRAERDEELGRWRWSERPEFVVHQGDDILLVVNELTGESVKRNGLYAHDVAGDAAAAYRDAHPEPKPWHDAKPHEVWTISRGPDDRYFPFRVVGRQFIYVDDETQKFAINDEQILDADRIYPPKES